MLRLYSILVLLIVALNLQAQFNRSIDGFSNNRDFPEWGSTGSVMPVWVSNGFQDSISEPGGMFRPNARLISNMIFDQRDTISDEKLLTEYVWVFGQFIDHDISLVAKNFMEFLPISVPQNDVIFDHNSTIPFYRSYAAFGSGNSSENPRAYENHVTSYIDASQIYGSDEQRANSLRTFNQGKLKTSQKNMLPWNTLNNEFNSPVDPSAPVMDNDVGLTNKLFIAGDVRANEHPLLISMHTLFVREHNRICDSLAMRYPHYDDELIYQNARKWVGAVIQSVLYNEWLPVLGIELDSYQGYRTDVNPGISNVFSAAAFRLGHSMISDDILRLEESGDTLTQGNISLKDAFFNPVVISLAGGIEPYLLGISSRAQQQLDYKLVNGVRNFLFGDPSGGGLDLAATNIMRGRDRGIPDYNTIRVDVGLEPIENFAELTDIDTLEKHLTFLYGNVNNIDAWVGMLLEEHIEGLSMGPLLYTIIRKQFEFLRDGDRYYFENDPSFSEEEKTRIRTTKLSDIILRNTRINKLAENVFILDKSNEEDEGPELSSSNLDVVLYPNPTFGDIQIKYFLSKEAQVEISLVDLFGRHLDKRSLNGNAGTNKYRLFIDNEFPPGNYFIFIRSTNAFKTLKVRYDKEN